MSERGSFVTEYIYCPKCFEAAKGVLLARDKYLCSIAIPHWDEFSRNEGPELPIIAGKIGGLGEGEELITFEFDINEKLSEVLCHPMRIAVLADSDERFFIVVPKDADVGGG